MKTNKKTVQKLIKKYENKQQKQTAAAVFMIRLTQITGKVFKSSLKTKQKCTKTNKQYESKQKYENTQKTV